ncbi:flagellar brake protein [Bacillus sp. FJAT-45350]|uniref:flagellar brake protein n=1 Tax=Bacillus sp. FJAT-45350 TaxID=2011014 RepID=UPI000BB8A025|nr:flagellar brake domain-containing protein [Bacillus sp. FJAT-45350]
MIEIGTTIFLELKEEVNNEKDHNKDKLSSRRFKSRLVDLQKDKFVIDYPVSEETKKISYFFEGTQFSAWFVGKDQAVYSFETEIQGRQKGQVPTLLLKDPGKENYVRIQRRNYVRVDTSVDVAIHPKVNEFDPFTTITLDISGGGAAIVIPPGKKIPHEGELYCWLVLPMQSGETYYVKTVCKIVRVFKKFPETRERASLQFVTIGEQDRQKVIRFCFEKQVAAKRKKS